MTVNLCCALSPVPRSPAHRSRHPVSVSVRDMPPSRRLHTRGSHWVTQPRLRGSYWGAVYWPCPHTAPTTPEPPLPPRSTCAQGLQTQLHRMAKLGARYWVSEGKSTQPAFTLRWWLQGHSFQEQRTRR